MAKYYLTGQNPQSALRIESDSIEKLKTIGFPAGNGTYAALYRIVDAGTGETICYSTKEGWQQHG